MYYDSDKIEKLREEYPVDTKIKLIYMEDVQAVPPGTCGKVICVDSAGTIHMKWENGSSLGLIPEEDNFVKL